MSYILDALKKSEQERQRKVLPNVLTVQDITSEKPARPRYWIYLAAAAMVIIVGTFTWWAAVSPMVHRDAHQTSKTGVVLPLTANGIRQTAPEMSKLSPEYVQPARPPLTHAANVPVSISKIPVRNDREPNLRVKAQAIQNVRSKIMLDQSGAIDGAKQNSESAPEIARQTVEPVAIPFEKATFPVEVPDPNRIYKLKDLPPTILKSLPTFSVSAFLYAESPASRMVRVNEQMMHEGQDLAGGVRLEEITRDGLVFSYRKFRFFIASK